MNHRPIDKAIMAGVLGIVIWTFISGALCDIDYDAAQYATISVEMLQNDTYLTVTESGEDYLDKPPFLFWINSISFRLFGFNNLAYKLPSLLISLMGLLYTYKLGAYLYKPKTGKVAAAIVCASMGFFWINNDVKTDAIVTAFIIFSIYQLILFIDNNKIKNLFWGSIGIGIGMLTKGPMGFIFPMAAIFIHLILKRNLNKLLRISWLLLPLVVAIILLPMCIGLYNQFDLHPEKVVNGRTGVSGLRFFFWDQSFGRITGENEWKNDTSFLYLFGAFLLLVFPYSVLTLMAYFKKLVAAFRSKGQGEEYYLLGGSLLILTLLSFSSYKIPHYAVVVLPLAGIIVAQFLCSLPDMKSVGWLKVHNIIIGIIVFLISSFSFIIFPFQWIHILIFSLLLFAFIYYQKKRLYIRSLLIAALILGFVFNTHIIPGFQKYSEGRRFAELIIENDLQDETIYFFNRKSQALEFYLQSYLEQLTWEELLDLCKKGESAWFYMSLDGKEALQNAGLRIDQEYCLMIYDMNRIKPAFLNPKTRQKSLEHRFLIKYLPR